MAIDLKRSGGVTDLMRHAGRIVSHTDVDVEYEQFAPSSWLRRCRRVTGFLTWPLVVPLACMSRASDIAFRTFSELLALAPYAVGIILRQEFYRWTLRRCGDNVIIGFGTVFLYRDVEVGDNVLIGMYNTIHHCDFGPYVLIGDACRFLSGPRYHRFRRTDVPMALQGGQLRRIGIGEDCWIGSNAVIMQSIGTGSIVGAGSVVTVPVEPFTVVAGNPARPIKHRENVQAPRKRISTAP